MKKETPKYYDAFISYRHTPLDMFVAKTIQKKLEEFKLPKNVKRQQADWERKKIEKVFRDQDELPITSDLSDQIYQALTVSDYLIVICSPRIKESLWCQQEIQTFIEMRGYDHVLPVLIEGEPEEAFPDEIVYRQEPYTDEYGNVSYELVPVEPLAADVRGSNKKEIKKKIEEEIMRLVAPMFSVDYDDLKQRHKEQRIKKRLKFVAGIAAGLGILSIVSGIFTLRIMDQNRKIDAQSVSISKQYEEIKEQQAQLQEQYDGMAYREAQSMGIASLNYLENGDRENALKYAYMSVTEDDDGVMMPVTSEGIKALFQSTYTYENGHGVRPEQIINYENGISKVLLSPNEEYFLVHEKGGMISIYDTKNLRLVRTIDSKAKDDMQEYKFVDLSDYTKFINDRCIIFSNNMYFAVYDFLDDEVLYSYSYKQHDSYDCNLQQVENCYEKGVTYLFTYGKVMMYYHNSRTLEELCDLSLYEYDKYKLDRLIFDFEQNSASFCYPLTQSEDTANNEIEYQYGKIDLATGEIIQSTTFFADMEFEEITKCQDKILAVGISKEFSTFSVEKRRFLCCLDESNMKMLWKSDMSYTDCNSLASIYADHASEKGEFCIVVDFGIYFFDASTGNLNYSKLYNGMIVSAKESVMPDSQYYQMTIGLSTGEVINIVHGGYWSENVLASGLPQNIKQIKFLADKYIACTSHMDQLTIYTSQRGLRMESVPNDTGYITVFDPDRKTQYVSFADYFGAYDLQTKEELWRLDYKVKKMDILKNGNLWVYYDTDDGKKMCLIQKDTKEVIYDEKITLFDVWVNYENSIVYFHDGSDVCMFDANSMVVSSILKDGCFEEYLLHNCILSSDGTHVILENITDGYGICKVGEEPKKIDILGTLIKNILFIPNSNCFLIIMDDETYQVFDNDTLECVGVGETAMGSGYEIQTYPGGGDTPYVITIDDRIFFLDKDYQIVYQTNGKYYPIQENEVFLSQSDDGLWLCPFYTIDLLIEDAEKIRSGEASTRIEQ